jgi:predicted nuclease of predicted toxin-antitoxin system
MRTVIWRLRPVLRRRGIDVTTTPEAGLISATDEVQAAYALAECRVIITQDRDFLRLNIADIKETRPAERQTDRGLEP